jgi:DNA helicase-2/ATP-dependent DNA helicase PcrA
MNFKDELNEEQYAAVTAPDGPSLVIAAAGTGKTRTLVYRLAWLVETHNIDPRNMLLLTFTNKAAREMLDRAEALIGRPFKSSYSGTFHSFANRILRSHAPAVRFGCDFTILDSDDSKKLLRSCADELKMDKKHFPKPQVLQSIFGVISGQMGDLADGLHERFEHTEVDPDDVIRVHDLYQKRKKQQNAMDFDDLLIYALQLLEKNERILRFYQEEFQYILVDEYQDTNAIQARMVSLLAKAHQNIMVVGDDFQSIYSWRGADFRNFLDFERHYPGTQEFKLQINYRSTPEILEVANAAIAGNPEQFQKTLHAVRDEGAYPVAAQLRDGSAQARYIIEKAQELKREGIAFSDMCVLYRSHFHAMELQMELARASMPYVVTSGVRFFEQAHIKDVCTLLRILVNPGDEMAFTRLLELFPKVGQKTSLKIFRSLGGRVNLQRKEVCMQVEAALPAAAREEWKKIEPVFLAYREENLDADPGEIVYRFNKAFYNEYMVENFDNSKYRAEDIDGLIDFTTKFETTEAFLSEIALLSNLDAEGDTRAETAPADAFRLSTIHQAKGLEFKVVFVLFLCENMFPSTKALEDSTDSEERRLFYVAVTRAEDRLYLCTPEVRRQRDGGIIFLEPSRFLREIPPELLRTEHGAIPRNTYYAAPKSPTLQRTPPQQPAAFKNTLNTSNAMQTHLRQTLEEKEAEVSLIESLSNVKFSAEQASIEVLLNKSDLPDFRGYKHEEIKIPGSIFHESLNHLHQCKQASANCPDFSLKVRVRYDCSKIHEVSFIESNLPAILDSFIEENRSVITQDRLAKLIEGDEKHVEIDQLINNALGVKNDKDVIDALTQDQKHCEQITYLSLKHCSEHGRIKLVANGDSILTVFNRNDVFFIIWEMFDGNATYIWKAHPSKHDSLLLSGEIRDVFEEIAADVQIIKPGARISYRSKQKKENPNFDYITHVYSDDKQADFAKWKQVLFDKLDAMSS